MDLTESADVLDRGTGPPVAAAIVAAQTRSTGSDRSHWR
jgi:hypothetical protein